MKCVYCKSFNNEIIELKDCEILDSFSSGPKKTDLMEYKDWEGNRIVNIKAMFCDNCDMIYHLRDFSK